MSQEPISFFGAEEDERFIRKVFDSGGEIPSMMKVNNVKSASALINKRLAVACAPFSIYYRYLITQPEGLPFSFLLLSDMEFEREFYLYRRRGFPKTPAEADALRCIEENVNSFMASINEYYIKVLEELNK